MRSDQDRLDDVRRLDPIRNADRLASWWASSDLKTAVLDEIAATPVPVPSRARLTARTRTRRRLAIVGAAFAAALALVVIAGGLPRSSSPAYAVERLPNGLIVVKNTGDVRDVSGLQAKLAEYGIEANLVSVPTSPSIVGTAQAYAPGEELPVPGVTFGAPGSPDALTMTIDPKVFLGGVTIELYVQAQPGEHYQVAASVFDPGEVLGGLQCALGTPMTAAEVAARLPALGITPVWLVVEPVPGQPDTTHETRVDQVPDGVILDGYALDNSTVQFHVLPVGVPVPSGYDPSHLSDAPCTAELAAPWR